MKDAPKTYINCLFIFSANTLVAAFFIALLWPIRNAFSISSKASKGSISKTFRNKGAISYPSLTCSTVFAGTGTLSFFSGRVSLARN